jgi:hypothetical protein
VPKHLSHLTTEQISAFLDQQLSAQEQSVCQTHLSVCDSCQQQLAELQQTVLLVRALPRVPLSRSFVLPIESTIQNTAIAEQEASSSHQARLVHNRILRWPRYVHTGMSVTSALVAVLGLFFILSGLLTIASPNAGTSQVPTSLVVSQKLHASSSSLYTNQAQPPTGAAALLPNGPQTKQPGGGSSAPSPNALPPQIVALEVGTAVPASNASQPASPATPENAQISGPLPSTSRQRPAISFFDLGTSEGHLGLGLLLLIAGMLSTIVFTKLGKQAQKE